ncbi:MAG TPA: hypothetical protein PLM79_15430 [Syntrophobacteraceae bacterium]|nr:hypothetical protein [Syntrophobacteraceae bacterium]
MGSSNLGLGLHGIFRHLETFPGPTAIFTQSGGVGPTMGYALRSLGTGLSYFIGVGNASVVDVPDYLEILEEDPTVRCFTLFLEGLQNPRLFFETARRVCIRKPIVAYKAGKHEEVSKATQTHTGNLASDTRLYRAMMKQAGICEADSIRKAAAASKALGMLPVPRGDRLCALTFTAGPPIVAMDKLLPAGWQFPDLSPDTLRKVRSIIGEATPVRLRNPVDLTGPGFLPQTYAFGSSRPCSRTPPSMPISSFGTTTPSSGSPWWKWNRFCARPRGR